MGCDLAAGFRDLIASEEKRAPGYLTPSLWVDSIAAYYGVDLSHHQRDPLIVVSMNYRAVIEKVG